MITIQDVAKAAGVSVATVSRVLNNHPSVSEKTREKVQRTIDQLNYQPNLLGRNLRRSETKMILVLLQNIANPFYSKIVKGMEDVGYKNGYHIMICNTDSDPIKENAYLKLLKNRLVDGVVFMAPVISDEELTEISKNYCVVQCCEYKEFAGVSSVSIDNEAAAYKATQHLISQGHRRIGLINGNSGIISESQREKGYKRALQEAGIEIDSQLIMYDSYGYRGGQRAAKYFLSIDKRPTAIFAVSDIIAIGAIKEIKEKGLSVPKDMAVVGFDDTGIASMYDPPLTTVAQPRYDLGRVTMEIMLERIRNNEAESKRVFLEHSLIIRESTVG